MVWVLIRSCTGTSDAYGTVSPRRVSSASSARVVVHSFVLDGHGWTFF